MMEIPSDIRLSADANQTLKQQEVKSDLEAAKITPETSSPPLKTDAGNIELPAALLNMDKMSQVLVLAGLKPTDTNLKMLQAMLLSGFPADKENLMKMNQAFKLTGQSIEKALFFMGSEIRMNSKNAEAVDNYSKNNIKILNQLEAVFSEINALPKGELKASIREIFNLGIFSEKSALANSKPQNQADVKTLSGTEPQRITAQKVIENAANEGNQKIIPLNNDLIMKSSENIAKALGIENNNDVPGLLKDIAAKVAELSGKSIANLTEGEINDFLDKLPVGDKVKEELFKGIKNIIINESVSIDASKSKMERAAESSDLVSEEPVIKQKSESDAEQAKENVMKKFALDVEKGGKEEIGKVLSDIKAAVEQAKEVIAKSDTNSGKLMQTLTNVSDNIDFMTQIKNSVYIQIPIMINNEKTNAEIFVFQNKRSKKTAQSALISLDLARLKHLEAYLHKTDNQLSCQFRVAEDWVEAVIREALPNLTELLSAKNISLTAVSYKKVNEPFTIIDKEPGVTDAKEPELFLDVRA